MDKEISSFESKMEEIRAKKYNELSNIEKDIQLLEFLRKDYESTNMRFKGIKYLFKLYKINPTCKKIATKEIFDIVSKIYYLYFYILLLLSLITYSFQKVILLVLMVL